MSLEQEDKECAAVAVAPRVTLADIEASVAEEHFFTGAEAVGRGGFATAMMGGPLALLTICVLVLRNGFTVIGTSSCADPKNFNAEMGKKVARENAMREVWKLLGFRLRDKLHQKEIAAAS